MLEQTASTKRTFFVEGWFDWTEEVKEQVPFSGICSLDQDSIDGLLNDSFGQFRITGKCTDGVFDIDKKYAGHTVRYKLGIQDENARTIILQGGYKVLERTGETGQSEWTLRES